MLQEENPVTDNSLLLVFVAELFSKLPKFAQDEVIGLTKFLLSHE